MKRMQQASESRPESVFVGTADALPALVWSCALDGTVVSVNSEWTRFSGLAVTALLGDGILAVIHPDDRARVRTWWKMTAAGDAGGETTYRLRRADGEFRRHAVRRVGVCDGSGGIVHFIATAIDIEDHAKRDAVLAASQASEVMFRQIAESIPHMLFTTTPSGEVDWCNAGFAEYLGVPADSARGAELWRRMHPEELPGMRERWQRSLAHGEPFEMECRIMDSAGDFRWFLSRAVPVCDPSGAIIKWYGSNTEIDERRRVDETIRMLADAGIVLSEARDVESGLTRLAELATSRLSEVCSIFLTGAHGELAPIAVVYSESGREGPLAEGASAVRALREQRTIVLGQSQMPASLANLGIRSYLATPLISRGVAIGVLTLVNAHNARGFSEADVTVAEILARRCGIVVDNVRLLEEEQLLSRRMRTLADASIALIESFNLREMLDRLVSAIIPGFGDCASILLFEKGGLRVSAMVHADPELDGVARAFLETRPVRPEVEAVALARLQASAGASIDEDPQATSEAVMRPYLLPLARKLGAKHSISAPIILRGEAIGVLTAHYSRSNARYREDDKPLFEELARRAVTAIEHARSYERERRVATTFQRASLPQALPIDDRVTFSAVYIPGSADAEVGGDWYDAFRLRDGRYMVSIGDVAGRGLAAAVVMGRLRQAIRTLALHLTDPARLLDDLDDVLLESDDDEIVTAIVGVIDPRTGILTYASAGHPPPMLRMLDGRIVELPCDGFPLGLRQRGTTKSKEFIVPPESMLLFYTDGLIESTRNLDTGIARLQQALGVEAVLYSANAAQLVQESVLFDGSPDDVAVLSVSFGPSKRWTFEADDAQAAQDARGSFVEYICSLAEEGTDLFSAELIFGELVGNVVRHAPGPIDIAAVWQNDAATLHVIDRGAGFDLVSALPKDIMSESGRGLFMINSLSEAFAVINLPGCGTHAKARLGVRRRR